MIDPVACVDFIRDNAEKLAQAKANRIYIEESLRSIKSTVMQEHAGLTVGAQEREAYASEPYKTALAGLKVATQEEEALRWLMIAAQAKIEIWRSMEASGRAIDRAAR